MSDRVFNGKGFGPLEDILKSEERYRFIENLISTSTGLMSRKPYDEIFNYELNAYKYLSSEDITVRQYAQGDGIRTQWIFNDAELNAYCRKLSRNIKAKEYTETRNKISKDLISDELYVESDLRNFVERVLVEIQGPICRVYNLLEKFTEVIIDGSELIFPVFDSLSSVSFKHKFTGITRDYIYAIRIVPSNSGVMGARSDILYGVYDPSVGVYGTMRKTF